MELRQLEYFVAVAEERSFTRAAERVRISQSGVSAQIRQLERELGAELLDRSGRAITLTAAGRVALDHARVTLASAGAVSRSVGEVTGLLQGRVTLGMVSGCTLEPLFDALAAFHQARPAVEIHLQEGRSDRLVEQVRDGAVDVALVGMAAAAPLPDGLDSCVVLRDRLVAAVAPGHPLAGRAERAPLREVCAHPLVCMPAGTGLRAMVDQACAAQNLQPTITLEVSTAGALAALAVRGVAVAIMVGSMVESHHDRLTAVAITDVQAPALLSLVWRAGRNPAASELVDRCRHAFAGGRTLR
ncbi:LysR family transcriptional regulator [Parafrankia colletiae]|uniref:LysR family transcriptional regulator n=1 Tax=Parafrankia colletiae TaxID=573497 RepID=A0A1S1QTB5_9ACTN|nr:LysR substrate-binding domain-containing protein [Parafrankia colletiae]MCK9901426.1 LysR substrate-binding domain-containing protein [Frankia sp. Cpl3]OHV36292.1 LysR family transcriptional regulator [Parafrankia colletiae]